MTHALIVNQLTKKFGPLVAVDGISFHVKKGDCFGLLGPNGAGKTTTLEILEDIYPADSGTIEFPLLNQGESKQQHIGIQFQETSLQEHMTVNEALSLFAHLYGHTENIQSLIETCDLKSFLHSKTKKLSGGQRQRLLLALALIHNPQIIFLDEPTTGLDPHSRRKFWHLVKQIKHQGKTLILTTHYMDEAETLCDDIAIMNRGKIIERGSPKELLDKHFQGTHINLPNALLPQLTSFNTYQNKNGHISIQSEHIDKDLKQLIDLNIPLNQLTVYQPNLDDLFLKLTGEELYS